MRLPKTTEFLDPSKALAEEVRASGATDFIHVGIGGSALGPIALHRALNHPYHNLLSGRSGTPASTSPKTLTLPLWPPSWTW